MSWDFGDQVSSPALATTHTYLAPGTYTVTLTATDAEGASDPTPDSRVVTVTQQSAATLSAIQESVFSPRCSGCHPPSAGLNLSPGASHGALVNVASGQQPALLRVRPGDPYNSYLVRKLEGAAGISGSRMPQGGPFLTADELQQIRQWILAGAPNN